MNVKYLILGIIAFVIGVLFLIWIMKNPLFNKNDDDGSIEGGIRQLGRKNDDIRGYIDELVDRNMMTRRQADAVNPQKVYDFCNSSIGARTAEAFRAGRLYREQPFVSSNRILSASLPRMASHSSQNRP